MVDKRIQERIIIMVNRVPGAAGVETKRFQQSASIHSGAGEKESLLYLNYKSRLWEKIKTEMTKHPQQIPEPCQMMP